MIVTTTSRMQPPAGTVLHVAGELDTFSAEGLRDHLRQIGTWSPGAVVVDLSGVTFMSCTALAVLAEARTQLGPRLFVDGRSRMVTRLLQITGLSTFFADLADDDREPPSARAASPPMARASRTSWDGSITGAAGVVPVERAWGLLMAVHGCTVEEASGMLTAAAEDYGVPVRDLVDLLVRAPRAGDPAPSAGAAVATLALLMRPPADVEVDPVDDRGPDALVSTLGPGRVARLTST